MHTQRWHVLAAKEPDAAVLLVVVVVVVADGRCVRAGRYGTPGVEGWGSYSSGTPGGTDVHSHTAEVLLEVHGLREEDLTRRTCTCCQFWMTRALLLYAGGSSHLHFVLTHPLSLELILAWEPQLPTHLCVRMRLPVADSSLSDWDTCGSWFASRITGPWRP